MDGDLDKTHAALMAAAQKYTGKVNPLLLACGLIQEGLNLNQALAGHCEQMKKELDELKKVKLLTKLIEQYATAHGSKQPDKIVVEPLALVALGLKQSVAPMWSGIPVECRDFERSEVVKPGGGNAIGVFLDQKTSQIVACSLSTKA